MKKGWLKSLWESLTPSKYEAVGNTSLETHWTDTKTSDYAYITFLENKNGDRKLQITKTSSLLRPKTHPLYRKYHLPWVNKIIDLHNVPNVITSPYVYEKLGYEKIGTINIRGNLNGTKHTIIYRLYQHENGNRRFTEETTEGDSPTAYCPATRKQCTSWIHKEIETAKIHGFVPVKTEQHLQQVKEKNGKVITVDFSSQPKHPKR